MKLLSGLALALMIGSSSAGPCADIANGDGVVNIEDLLALLGAYGSKDAGKNIVGGTTIDIEDLLALLGQYGSKCSRGGGGKTFCRNYNTGNTGRYEAMGHPLGGKKAVTFDVQARNDAHIGFFSKKESNAEVYEIVLSGWGNKQSVIREKNRGRNMVAKRTTNLLNGNKAKSFWADAVKGLVRVGAGKSVGKNVLMQWQDKNPHDADSVGFMTGWGATGKWTNVCSPGVPATTVQKGLYFETYHRQGDTLASLGNPHFKKYGGRTPFVVHTAHGKNIWYSNDNDFKKEFNGFSKNDQYVMRWSGEYNAPKNGRYQFRTQSDDGSRIHVNGKMVVNNDGNHGPRNRQGAITLKKGWQKIVLSFYENGGGAMMRAWVAAPGTGWKVMTKSMFKASNVLIPNPPPPPPPPPGTGMWLEVYHRKNGQLSNWGSPLRTVWNNMKPIVAHKGFRKDVWYSNDNDFKREIAGFNKNNQYIMRWSGRFNAKKKGRYTFRTRSDDGSRVYVNGRMIVNNDGNHGPRSRQGAINLNKGLAQLVLTFYENGGGAMMQVSVAGPGFGWRRLTAMDTKPLALPPSQGFWLEAFNWNGKTLAKMGNPNYRVWDDQKPLVAHAEHSKKVWYSNDNDFKKEIPGFNKNNKYAMRWSGVSNLDTAGKYCFRTRSDDGSAMWVDGKRVVNNDGNHGPRTREGCINLKKGAHTMVATFYENGGGAMMQVSVKGPGDSTDGKWVQFAADMAAPIQLPPAPPPRGSGAFLEVYHRKSGQLSNWGSPLYSVWNRMKPITTQKQHQTDIWYSNDNDFKKEIKGFNKNNQYIMRWSGIFKAPKRGRYQFKTRSDDGSRLYINGKMIVNNDGNHGMRDRQGKTGTLGAGWHQIVITFYENGGGAGLQASVAYPGENNKWRKITASMLRPRALPPPQGLYLQAYKWNGRTLGQNGNPNFADWNGQKSIVAHPEFKRNLWYSNDNDFKKAIPGFNSNDKYAMRWSGQMMAPRKGKYCFWTQSDDGSQIWVDGKRVVDNDGNHGPRARSGCVSNLKVGWHQLVVTFYENGGGAMMRAQVSGPGFGWTRIAPGMTQPTALPLKWNPKGNGMYFEAFNWNGKSLRNHGPATNDKWDNQKPIVAHQALGKNVWYSNDNDFKKEIKGFNKNDRYSMRWSGAFDCPLDGKWGFQTRSDDGSMLYVNGKLVVSNDGNHGMRTRNGNVNLGKGKQELVITFYENGGGAGLQVSVKAPGQDWTPLTSKMTKAQKLKPLGGLYLEAFNWNGKTLARMGNPTQQEWDGQKPIVSHPAMKKDVWYSNDNDFKREVPGFSKNDRYAMRWAGQFNAAKKGRYAFRTRSDDGSQLWVAGKMVVNNDGNHGMRTRSGSINLNKGWHQIVITFYENGGGAGMQVSYAPAGSGWKRLSWSVTKPQRPPLGWKLNGNGMYVEVWHRRNGQLSNWGKPTYDFWKPSGGKKIATHKALRKDIWYSNDNDFKKAVNGFSKNDQYIFRFAGVMNLPLSGAYCFWTRSDDGSQVWVDGARVVNNDGNHGMRSRQGCRNLRKGQHELVITFYENGGGAGLQTQIKPPGGAWRRISYKHTRAQRLKPPSGMFFEAYDWSGKSLTQMGNPTSANWDNQMPMVAHAEFRRNVWYSNDNDFKRSVPGFNKNDRYAMRWSGQYSAAKAGKYCIRTRSDDGSQAWLGGQRIVNNDGNHGMRSREGCKTLKKGWHTLVLTFYENGGGAGMQVSVKGPGFNWKQLSYSMTKPISLPLRWQKNGKGLYFEAFNWNGRSLSNSGNPNYRVWNGQKPIVAHKQFGKDVWYSNDNDFKKAVPGFNKNDRYSMRWSGAINLPQSGVWAFKTRSDDGSQLFIDGVRIVNNDGNHGMRDRQGSRKLRAGNHELVITFYENGGGAGLQASVKRPGGGWQRITKAMTNPQRLSNPGGMYFEAYDWNGKSLTRMGNPNKAAWDGQTPTVAKSNFGRDVWYSNDNDFKKSIPGFSKNDRYAMRWTGNLNIPGNGKWCVQTISDDGSQAWFDGKRIVNNDGNHGMRTREGCVTTKKGWHKLVLTFYENGGGAGMKVSIKGPQTGNKWTKLKAAMTTPRRP